MAVAVAAAPISLTDEDRQMTVEQYLKAAASERAAALKRHGEELIERYDAEFKRARKVLRDAAVEAQARSADDSGRDDSGRDEMPHDTATTSEPSGSSEPSVDAFALVGIRGVHQGKIFKVEPAADRKTWSIGRTAENDFCLSGDDEVSSVHAKVSFDRKQFKLQAREGEPAGRDRADRRARARLPSGRTSARPTAPSPPTALARPASSSRARTTCSRRRDPPRRPASLPAPLTPPSASPRWTTSSPSEARLPAHTPPPSAPAEPSPRDEPFCRRVNLQVVLPCVALPTPVPAKPAPPRAPPLPTLLPPTTRPSPLQTRTLSR